MSVVVAALCLLCPVTVFADADNCPGNVLDFNKWATLKIQSMPAPTSESISGVAEVIEICRTSLPKTTSLVAADRCTRNLNGLAITAGSSSGLRVATPALNVLGDKKIELPKAMASPTLLAAIGSGDQKTIDSEFAKLSKALPAGSRIFQFQSEVIKRQSYVIVLTSPKEDIYIHTEEGLSPTYLAIRTSKQTDEGKPIDPPKIDFHSIESQTLKPTTQTDRCMSCHRSGSVAVVPVDGTFLSKTPGVSNLEMQTWWEKTRATQIDGSLANFSGLGPELGPDSAPSRIPEFMKTCGASEIPGMAQAEAEKLMKRMNCTHCHGDDRRLDTLRFPMHTYDFGFKVLDNIFKHGHMPLNSGNPSSPYFLNPAERMALLKCLKAEYFGGFTDKAYSNGNSKPGVLMNYLTQNCGADANSPPKSVEPAKTKSIK